MARDDGGVLVGQGPMENGLPVELGEQELLGSWPEKWRPEHGRVWAFGRCHPWKLLPLEEQAGCHR